VETLCGLVFFKKRVKSYLTGLAPPAPWNEVEVSIPSGLNFYPVECLGLFNWGPPGGTIPLGCFRA